MFEVHSMKYCFSKILHLTFKNILNLTTDINNLKAPPPPLSHHHYRNFIKISNFHPSFSIFQKDRKPFVLIQSKIFEISPDIPWEKNFYLNFIKWSITLVWFYMKRSGGRRGMIVVGVIENSTKSFV